MRLRSSSITALVSGGADSAVMVRRLLETGAHIHPLYVRGGMRWEAAELFWLRRFLKAIRSPRLRPLQVIEVPLAATYGRHWSFGGDRVPGARTPDAAVYLPGRNVLLLGHAAVVAARHGSRLLAVGTLRGNPFGDASQGFFRRFGACLAEALDHPVRILAPLRRLTKPQALRAAHEVPLALTFSCLRPIGWQHCGACNKCAERRRAFRAAGVFDPTQYHSARF